MASSASVLATIVSLEWVEEVLILLIVFILLHKSMTAAGLTNSARRKRKAKKQAEKKAAMMASDDMDVDEEERPVNQYQRRTEPKVPETAVDIPGVTDSRFTGTIIAYYPENGYGFIRCQALFGRFTKEVFLHRLQIGGFTVGSSVSFGVFLNSKGWPQAKDLRAAEPSCDEAGAPAAPRREEESWRKPWPEAATQKKSSVLPAEHRANEGSDGSWRLAQTVVEQISQDAGRSQHAGGKKSPQRQNNRHQHASSNKNSGTWDDDWAAWDDWTAWDDWSAQAPEWDDWSTQAPEPSEQQQKPKAKGPTGQKWTLKAKAC